MDKEFIKIIFINYVLNKAERNLGFLIIPSIIFESIKPPYSANVPTIFLNINLIGILLFTIFGGLTIYKNLSFNKKEIKTIKKSTISKKYKFIQETRKYALEKAIDYRYLYEFICLTTEEEINNRIDEIITRNVSC